MKLFILGANGHTGTQIIDLAVIRKHRVTAFVRSPEKIRRQHPLLNAVKGDPRSIDQLARSMKGHDAVLSALGVRPPAAFRPHTVVRDCATSTAAAMSSEGIKRLVLVSAAVLFPMKGLMYAFFRQLLKHIARDLDAAEQIVRGAAVDWTIARPPRLTGGSGEHYQASRGSLPNGASSMSFRAVAAFMLDAVEQHSYIYEIVGLGS